MRTEGVTGRPLVPLKEEPILTGIIFLPLVSLTALSLGLSFLFRALAGRISSLTWLRPGSRRGTAMALLLGTVCASLFGVIAITLLPDRGFQPEPRGSLQEAEVFVVFAFGLGRQEDGQITAGDSNREIARWLIEHKEQRKPAIVQEGIYLALKEEEKADPGLGVDDWTIRLPHHPGVYVDTNGAALQCCALLPLKGYRRPVLAAHPLHLQRMVWSFERLGMEDSIVPNMPAIPLDPNSSQHWGTRSRTGWLVWELLFARPLALRPRLSLSYLLLVGILYWAAWCFLQGKPAPFPPAGQP